MKKILYVLLLMPSLSFAGIGACHDGSGNILKIAKGVSTAGFLGETNCEYYNDQSASYTAIETVINTVPRIYIKFTTEPVEMNQSEKDAVDSTRASNRIASTRTRAKSRFDGQTTSGQSLRCLADITKREVNILRDWLVDFKAEVSSSTSLGNFQSRVAGLPDTPGRTLAQLKSQIQTCIDDGDVDE